jgi:hypothetical protein
MDARRGGSVSAMTQSILGKQKAQKKQRMK